MIHELIARLEKAIAPHRQLDADIYRAAVDEFAPSFTQYRGLVWSGSRGKTVPEYTASIDAALTLVPDDCNWTVDGFPDGLACASCYVPNKGDKLYDGATPAIALCIAALKARLALTDANSSAE